MAGKARARVTAKKAAPARKYDPEKTKRDILATATKEFARDGYNGARIDAIAARTATTKRMIYYYFGSKEKLYIAVLEHQYARIRAHEAGLNLDLLSPETAIRRLAEATFDYDHANPDFVRLVAIENIHHARHLKMSKAIRSVNATIVDTIDDILERGRAERVFNGRIRAVDVHMLMSALCFFHVSNLHTFSAIFRRDFLSPVVRKAHRTLVADFIVHLLKQSKTPALY
jgi:AcrR family transcriptional regulator